LSQEYTVIFLCDYFGVSKSGYYKWMKRRGSLNRYEQNRKDLLTAIEEFHTQHPSYGYRDIASKIREKKGWMVSDLYVHKGCKFAGVRSQVNHYHWKKTGEEHILYRNIVDGNWNTQRPLEILCSDMTVLKHRGIAHEWTFILDTFNNAIIASSISATPNDNRPYYDCLDQLLELIKKEEQTEPIIFHSDQGSVYSSRGFAEAHKNYNIIRSMSRSGTPTDNPIIESINGWIKAEIHCDYRVNDWDSLASFMKDYIQFFNYERPSYKLKYKTPAQFMIEQGQKCFL
jgi:putative transposase